MNMRFLGKVSLGTLYLLNITIIFFGGFVTLGFGYYNKYGSSMTDDLLAKADKNTTTRSTPTPIPTPAPIPLGIIIPKLEVKTDVIPVGVVENTNQMEVPNNGDLVGWYEKSESPGEIGASVMTAHYDMPGGAPAIFYGLQKLEVGDSIWIINDHNKKLDFKVTKLINERIEDFPIDDIFEATNSSQLSLITCSGVWNSALQIYSNRLAVIGELVEESDYGDYLASAGNDAQIFLSEIVEEDVQDRDRSLNGVYVRLEKDEDKVLVFLATNNREVFALHLPLTFDQNILDLSKDISISGDFEIFNVNDSEGEMVLSFYNEQLEMVNTKEKEVKIAEIPYHKEAYYVGNINIGQAKVFDENQRNILSSTKGIQLE